MAFECSVFCIVHPQIKAESMDLFRQSPADFESAFVVLALMCPDQLGHDVLKKYFSFQRKLKRVEVTLEVKIKKFFEGLVYLTLPLTLHAF